MIFSFKAYTHEGQKIKSKLQASSQQEALTLIEEKGLLLISLSKEFFVFKNPFKKPNLFLFTDQMSQLLQSQISLHECLKILQQQLIKNPLGEVIDQLKNGVENGQPLHQCMQSMPLLFDPFYCRMIEMGEKTAELALIFRYLAEELKTERELKKQIVAACSYPIILSFFCLLLVFLSFFYLLPTLEELFENRSTSFLTHSLFAISRHLRDCKISYALGLPSLLFLLIKGLKSKKVAIKITLFELKVPFLNTFLKTKFLFRLSKSLSLLLKAKVPLVESLELCQNISLHPFFDSFLKRTVKKVKEGQSLSLAMQNETWLFPLWLSLVFVGEQSGQLEESFKKLSDYLETQLKSQVKKGISLLSPLLLLIMAAIIGLLTLGILLPLTDFQSIAL